MSLAASTLSNPAALFRRLSYEMLRLIAPVVFATLMLIVAVAFVAIARRDLGGDLAGSPLLGLLLAVAAFDLLLFPWWAVLILLSPEGRRWSLEYESRRARRSPGPYPQLALALANACLEMAAEVAAWALLVGRSLRFLLN